MKKALFFALVFFLPLVVAAQDLLPVDNGLATYHTSPRYRESESHPVRVLAYAVHPIGWVLREVLFRPLSYFASSTETTRSVMGYREPFDYRQPECFSADDSSPDCRSLAPFNYGSQAAGATEPVDGADTLALQQEPCRQVYFPDVNFDFDKRILNDLGRGRVRQIAQLLKQSPELRIVLEGNADYVGTEAYNNKLALDRAEAVRQELVSLGIEPAALSTVTFGQSKPIFEDKENWARAVNRRVEVKVAE